MHIIYGRDVVNVESDHQPLETIMQKPLSVAPNRLQRLLLQLQKYALLVRYKKGTQMYLADTLSRAFLTEETTVAEIQELELVDHTEFLAMGRQDLLQLKQTVTQDTSMQELWRTIQRGWPSTKAETPDAARPYFDCREQMTTQGELVFKGKRVVIPAALRAEMMSQCHASHIGIEGCLRRAQEVMYWPKMSADIKDYVARCDVCLSHRDSPLAGHL